MTVTLLFTDLVGSTELLEQLGDDAFESLRRRHFQALRQALRGGEEVKNLGDGLMVAFASASDAIASGVAMQQAAAGLSVRIGIHVGEASCERGDYFGTPVVLAQRLCSAAQGGQILVSELVRALVGIRGDYGYRDVGPLSLKGFSGVVPAYEVTWEPLGAGSVFVGREIEMAELRNTLAEVIAGRGRLVLVAGEPGIGKTRLAEELGSAARAEGAQVVWGRAHEGEGAPAYWPFTQVIRSLLDYALDMGEGASHIAQMVPEVKDHLEVIATPPAADAEGARFRIFDAVATFFARVGRRQPLALMFDDLHWADPASLLLLEFVSRRMRDVPLPRRRRRPRRRATPPRRAPVGGPSGPSDHVGQLARPLARDRRRLGPRTGPGRPPRGGRRHRTLLTACR